MFDQGKILVGLLIFLILLASPALYNLAGGSGPLPRLETGTTEPKCLESAEYMRANHMTMLNAWREAVIRNGERVYTASDGRHWDMSLTQTCLVRCHVRKTQFCDKCHNYSAVTPYCWDCHLAPEEKQ